MLHPTIGFYREDSFGTDPAIELCPLPASGVERHGLQSHGTNGAAPKLTIHVEPSSDPLASLSTRLPVHGVCIVFLAPFQSRQPSIRHQILAHPDDYQSNDVSGCRQSQFVATCIRELEVCPVALTSPQQIAAFLLLRCSLSVASGSDFIGLIDECAYLGDASTASALLSHEVTRSEEVGGLLYNDSPGSSLVASCSRAANGALCSEIRSTSSRRERDVGVVIVMLSFDQRVLQSVLRVVNDCIRPGGRVAVVGPSGGFLVSPSEVIHPAALHAIDSSQSFVDVEACWVSVSDALGQWRRADQTKRSAHSTQPRTIILLTDYSVSTRRSSGNFLSTRYVNHNPMFYNATCHCISFGTLQGNTPFDFRDFYLLATRKDGQFLRIEDQVDSVQQIGQAVGSLIAQEQAVDLSRIHFFLQAENTVSTEGMSGVFALDLPRISGRIVGLNSLGGGRSTCLSFYCGDQSPAHLFIWGFSATTECFVVHRLQVDKCSSRLPSLSVKWSQFLDVIRYELPLHWFARSSRFSELMRELEEAFSESHTSSIVIKRIQRLFETGSAHGAQQMLSLCCQLLTSCPSTTDSSAWPSKEHTQVDSLVNYLSGSSNTSTGLPVPERREEGEEDLELRGVCKVDTFSRTSTLHVDERWLSLGPSLEATSSIEGSMTRTLPAGIVTQKSFSLSVAKFSHGVVYVTLSASDALANVPRSPNIKIVRKLFLCEVSEGELNIVQKETIYSGPTWRQDESAFTGISASSTDHAFYNLDRGKSYCVVHLAALIPDDGWVRISDFLVADGVEFATPISYVQDVVVNDVTARSVSLAWDGNCNGYMVSYHKVAAQGMHANSEDIPAILCTSSQRIQLSNLSPLSVYLVRVSPNCEKHSEAVETEEVIVATPPEVDRSMVVYSSYTDPKDLYCVNVKVGLVLPLAPNDIVDTTCASELLNSKESTPSLLPLTAIGKDYELVCTPTIQINHASTSLISLRAGSPVIVHVGFEMVVVRRKNNFRVFSKVLSEVLSSRLGPFHVLTNLTIRSVSDAECEVAWRSSNLSGATRLHVFSNGRSDAARGTPAPCPSAAERRADEVVSPVTDDRLITVPGGTFDFKICDLIPDCEYTVSASCEGVVAEQTVSFRTTPPPPKASQLLIHHNSSLKTLLFSFPSCVQLGGRMLRATVFPSRSVHESSQVEPQTAVSDISAAVSNCEPVRVQLTQYTDVSSSHRLESDPITLFAVSNVLFIVGTSDCELRFVCGYKNDPISVGIGSQYVVAREGNSRAIFSVAQLSLAPRLGNRFGDLDRTEVLKGEGPFAQSVKPVVFNGPSLLEEQTSMYCLLSPLPPWLELFSVRVFEGHAIIEMDATIIDSFLNDLPADLWQTGAIQANLVFVSQCMEPVSVPMPLPPPPPTELRELDAEESRSSLHSVIVPLAQSRSLTSTLSSFFEIRCDNTDNIFFVNSVKTVYSPPVIVPAPRVFDIGAITVTSSAPRSAVLEWRSGNDLYDISVLSNGVSTLTTKTTQSRIALDGLTPGTAYYVVITGNMSGSHEAHLTFVTPIELSQIPLRDFCESIRITEDGVLHAELPPTQQDLCTADPLSKNNAKRLTQIVAKISEAVATAPGSDFFPLAAPPCSEWKSQQTQLSAAISLFDPRILETQCKDVGKDSALSNLRLPHIEICALSCVVERGARSAEVKSESKRVDILGCPRVVFTEDYEFATLHWIGSASIYNITLSTVASITRSETAMSHGTLTKSSPSLLIRCADYEGQILSVSIKSLENSSNLLRFSVLMPYIRRSLKVLRHTLELILVELSPSVVSFAEPKKLLDSTQNAKQPSADEAPALKTSVHFEFEGVTYTYAGNGTDSMLCSLSLKSSRPTAPRRPTPIFSIVTRTEVADAFATDCLNRVVEVSSRQELPVLRLLSNIAVSDTTQTTAEVRWTSDDDEFYCTVRSYTVKYSGGGVDHTERSIVVSTTCLKLRSLAPGSYHEVVVRGRRTGDTELQTYLFTRPTFPDRSVSFRRHQCGTKYTVLVDDCTESAREPTCYGNLLVSTRIELLICDSEGNALETHSIGVSPLTLEFASEMSNLYVRKTLVGTEVSPSLISEGPTPLKVSSPEIRAETKILICRARRYVRLSDLELKSIGPNSVDLIWPPQKDLRGDLLTFTYAATLEAVETLSSLSVERIQRHAVVVHEPYLSVKTLIESTLYRVCIRVDGNFRLYTDEHPSVIIHDEAPEVPSVSRYILTPGKKPLCVPHKRYVGGLTLYLEMGVPSLRPSRIRSFETVRILPDNTFYVHAQPWSNMGVPSPSIRTASAAPTFLIIPPSTPKDNNRFCVDVPLSEPATQETHRLEYYHVVEISREFPDFKLILNPSQYSEAEVQTVNMVRALTRPQCVAASSTRAELTWSISSTAATHESVRFDVVVENLLGNFRQEVQRVAEERVVLENLLPGTAYRVTVGACVREVPCEPVSAVLVTAPKKPKAPKLSVSQLNVIFDIPPSVLHQSSDGHKVTVTTTALVICTKELKTENCRTAVDFIEKTQTRNIFRSSMDAAQRVDLRLRSSKSYQFVFFNSIHHPESMNGVVHSKPTVVELSTECFPPQNLRTISRTKHSVSLGWASADLSSRGSTFEVQRVAIGPIKSPSTLAALQSAVAAAGGLPPVPSEDGEDGEQMLMRALSRGAMAIDLFSERFTAIETLTLSSSNEKPPFHCTFTNLSPDILCAFRVRQTISGVVSGWSNTVVTSALAPPTPVSHLRVTHLAPTSLSLSWVPSHSVVEGESTSYLVQIRAVLPTISNSITNQMHTAGARKADKGFEREEVCHGTAFEVCDLSPSCQYRIIVVPINHYGEKCEGKNATLLVRTEAQHNGWR